MSEHRFIRNFAYLIGGFTQKTGADTGMMRLWAMLFRWRAERGGGRSAFTFIMPREWNDSVKEMAELLARHSVAAAHRRVVIAGYSWGAGFGGPRLARELERQGVAVDLMLLIDPIYRSKLPLMFRLLAFTTWFDVKIPANVRAVAVWRQRNDALAGTSLRLANPAATRLLGDVDLTGLGLNHETIQYHPPLLARCLSSIRRLFEGATSAASPPSRRDESVSHLNRAALAAIHEGGLR